MLPQKMTLMRCLRTSTKPVHLRRLLPVAALVLEPVFPKVRIGPRGNNLADNNPIETPRNLRPRQVTNNKLQLVQCPSFRSDFKDFAKTFRRQLLDDAPETLTNTTTSLVRRRHQPAHQRTAIVSSDAFILKTTLLRRQAFRRKPTTFRNNKPLIQSVTQQLQLARPLRFPLKLRIGRWNKTLPALFRFRTLRTRMSPIVVQTFSPLSTAV